MTILKTLALPVAAACAVLSLGGSAEAQRPEAQRAEAQHEDFQHVPLPAKLPAGVSVAQAQKLQAIVDEFRFVEPLVVSKLGDNLYLAKGGADNNAPNAGFMVGRTGVVLVNNKNSINVQKGMLAEIAKITPNAVTASIVLHSEHESGLAALPAGVTIIAHQNAKRRMEESTARDKVAAAYLPTKLVGNDETMTIDGVRIRLLQFAPGATDSDLIAYFPDQKVAFASSALVMNFPLASTVIHPELGGSVRGWIENAKGLLALDANTYVPDHGAVLTKEDLRTKVAFVQDRWDDVKAMVAQGKSLEQIKAALPGPPDRDQTTLESIYTEVKTK